jgi:hypothetical protein
MNKEIFDKLVQSATDIVLDGYIPHTIPPEPIYREVFNKEKFAKLIFEEALYIGAGLFIEIGPQYNGVITVHEAATWQVQMREHFKVKAE